MNKMLVLAAGAAIAAAAPAYAAPTLKTTAGSAAAFMVPALPGMKTAVFNFNSAAKPAGFTASYVNASRTTGTHLPFSAQPAYSDGSAYLAVLANGSATLLSHTGYSLVSFYLGSIDSFNKVEILGTAGQVISSYSGADFVVPANGNQTLPQTNRRITYTIGKGDAMIGGIRFTSKQNAAEIDNVVFAVPEPSTWAMMLVGFGMMGLAMRSRQRKTAVVYA
ncbi:PEPxxWA-CTERM sorting domain-containing protein [Sphingomonas sp. Tas61C01]|uniref:PEPxxWA-CTERM sorting domain-containing protein n=1 Tax=Sphingomonas sp. Tas61C01 TaxID=3458297 RepID=UPI00403EB803